MTSLLLTGATFVAAGVWIVAIVHIRNARRESRRAHVRGADQHQRAIQLLIVLTWLYSLLPAWLQVLRSGRTTIDVTDRTSVTGIAAHVATLLSTAAIVLCLVLVVTNTRSRPERGIGWLLAFIAPWFALQVVAARFAGDSPGRQVLIYPLVGLTLWLVSPPVRVLSILGWLTIFSAAASIVFGLLSPLGLFGSGGAGIDKSLLFGSLLTGPYSHPNELGLVLALGTPAVFLIESARARTLGLVLVGVALTWTAARTSIVAFAIVVIVYTLGRRRSSWFRHTTAALAIAVACATVVLTPLLSTNPLAFSSRGQIWIASLDAWRQHVIFGNGPGYYLRQAALNNELGQYAFHGHNLLVDYLTTGGVIAVIALAAMLIAAFLAAVRSQAETMVPTLFVLAFVSVGWLEVVTDFGNLGAAGYASWIPLGIITFARGEHHVASDIEPALTVPARHSGLVGR